MATSCGLASQGRGRIQSRQVFADADVGVVCMHLRIKWLRDDNFVVLHRYQQFIYLQISTGRGRKACPSQEHGDFWVKVNGLGASKRKAHGKM